MKTDNYWSACEATNQSFEIKKAKCGLLLMKLGTKVTFSNAAVGEDNLDQFRSVVSWWNVASYDPTEELLQRWRSSFTFAVHRFTWRGLLCSFLYPYYSLLFHIQLNENYFWNITPGCAGGNDSKKKNCWSAQGPHGSFHVDDKWLEPDQANGAFSSPCRVNIYEVKSEDLKRLPSKNGGAAGKIRDRVVQNAG